MPVVSIDKTELSQCKDLCFAGVLCKLSTNSLELVETLEETSIPVEGVGEGRFEIKVLVDEKSAEGVGKPHFRGMHHVVTASFGMSNVFVFDVLRRALSARISLATARDLPFWKEKLIPIALGVLGSAMGLVPVHCACLALEGDGLLIAGVSGAGKSTLSAAMSQAGFSYISDDWTYISENISGLMAYGTSAPVKLLPDAVRHFQGLNRHRPHISMNGELAYEVNIVETFGGYVERSCEPRWMIFLERTEQAGSEFIQLSSSETKAYLDSSVERLPQQLAEATAKRRRIIKKISDLPCWSFRYGGSPQFATELLRKFVEERKQEIYV